MAKLELTEEEKKAGSWLEFDDESIGRAMRHASMTVFKAPDDCQAARVSALVLANIAHRVNAAETTVKLGGFTINGEPCSDYLITVQKLDKKGKPAK